MSSSLNIQIVDLEVFDIRFPTHLSADGSDAMHTDPDYSCAYVILNTDGVFCGHGFTFTIGRGTEVVVAAVKALAPIIINQDLEGIVRDFAGFYRRLTSDTQLRWIGPEKGVVHMASAAIINAIWDLWAKIEEKPLWKLLVDMTPEEFVSLIDFRYISDFLTKDEALEMLKNGETKKKERQLHILEHGYPAYTTQVGWLGYPDQKLRNLCKTFKGQGFNKFKIKVGLNLEDDLRRCRIIREEIGEDSVLMVDANQRWEVEEAITWMKNLVDFKPFWIEEPTSPDDVLGHAAIAQALKPYGVKVATGEMCQNRVLFKQFLQAGGLDICQIDGCRVGGVNENLAIMLMAAKAGVPVCPHAGGVGLCELVQHLSLVDYVAISGSMEGRVTEYVDHLHEHFLHPVQVKFTDGCRYVAPTQPGFSTEMKESSRVAYSFPEGEIWRSLQNTK